MEKLRRTLICHECNLPNDLTSSHPDSYRRPKPNQTIFEYTVEGMRPWVAAGARPLIPTSLWYIEQSNLYNDLENELGVGVFRGVKNWNPCVPFSEVLASDEMRGLVENGAIPGSVFWIDNETHYMWRAAYNPDLPDEGRKIKDEIERIQDEAHCRIYLWCPHMLPINNVAFDDYFDFSMELKGLDAVFVTPYRGFGPAHLHSDRWTVTENDMLQAAGFDKQVPIVYLRDNGRWPEGSPGNPEFDVWSPETLEAASKKAFSLYRLPGRVPGTVERANPVVVYPGDHLDSTGKSVLKRLRAGRPMSCLK